MKFSWGNSSKTESPIEYAIKANDVEQLRNLLQVGPRDINRAVNI